MATTSKSAETKPEVKKPVEPSVTDNDSKNVNDPGINKSEHTGTHPDSFEPMNFERDFTPTDDANLDERGRWIKNEFFNAHGPTTVVRLDELANLGNKSYEGRGDSSDRELGREIIMRAGLGDHPRFNQLCDMMAVGLGEISDPGEWLHGYSKSASERTGENSSSSGSASG